MTTSPPAVDEETLAFLDDREQKLIRIIETAAGALDSVRRAKAGLLSSAAPMPIAPAAVAPQEEADRPSVPNMIRISLRERFPDGATTGQFLAYFRERWGRDLSKNGVSVALSQMKDKGEVRLENQVWIAIKANGGLSEADLGYYRKADPEMAALLEESGGVH